MDVWRLKEFEQLTGKTLKAVDMGTNKEFQVTVSELTANNAEEGWESFSVIMNCSEPFNQGNVEFFHEDLGSTMLFASPKSEQEIEIIVNVRS